MRTGTGVFQCTIARRWQIGMLLEGESIRSILQQIWWLSCDCNMTQKVCNMRWGSMEMPPKDCSTDLVRTKSPYYTSGITNMLLRCLMVELSYNALRRRWVPFQVGEKKMAVSILSALKSFLLFHYHLYSERRKWENAFFFRLPLTVAEILLPI